MTMIPDRLLDFFSDRKGLYCIDPESHSDNLTLLFLRLLISAFILKMDLMQKTTKSKTNNRKHFLFLILHLLKKDIDLVQPSMNLEEYKGEVKL